MSYKVKAVTFPGGSKVKGIKKKTVFAKDLCNNGGDKDHDDKKGGEKDFIQIQRRPHGRTHREMKKKTSSSSNKTGGGDDKSVSDLIMESALMGVNYSERLKLEDLGKKPDLWMVAFDNPMDFIQYCRKRMDHEKELLEKSRRTENEIINLIRRWTESSEKHAGVLDDLCKFQNQNDKLHEVIMEERTNCQHLVGENYQLEMEKKMLSRKYQAALMLGKVEDKSVKHLLESNPKAVPLTDKMADIDEKIRKCSKSKGGGDCSDPYVLAEKLEKLENYIKSLKRQHHEEVTVLKDTIANYDKKYDSLKLHYKEALQRNSHAFDEVRDVLTVSITENLDLREELLKRDDKFLLIQQDGIERLSRKLNRPPRRLHNNQQDFHEEGDGESELDYEEKTDDTTQKKLKLQLSKLEIEAEEKSNLLKDVLNKLMVLERTCSRLKEENSALKASHKHSLNALRERNQVLQKRCEKTDERRKLDNHGFREDIRELRFLIKTLDKNVIKFIRLHGELEAEPITPHVLDEDFEAIIETQKSVDRYKALLKNTDSKLVQKAMTSWTDFLENKLDALESMIDYKK